jgi:acyl carrier protein
MPEVRTRLVRCFAAVLPDVAETELEKATASSVGNWDSLTTVSLITVIEEEFTIQIAPEDFENFVSFTLILDYLQSKHYANVA